MAKSEWEEWYRRYKLLEDSWHCSGAHPLIERQYFDFVISSHNDPAIYLNEMKKRNCLPKDGQLEEALNLRAIVDTLPDDCSIDAPLEDVYQTALRMETWPMWKSSQEGSLIFRGQRMHNWKIVPSLFRQEREDSPEKRQLETHIEKIGGLVRHLQTNDNKISEEEGVAIIQHYSKEVKDHIGVPGTWLIDFTWDPFVALFFASYEGQDGDIGVISRLKISEWSSLSAGGENRFGAIRIIEPRGIPRILAQRALFLDTSHPDLYEQHFPIEICFKQKRGLFFEDKTRVPHITYSELFPSVDQYAEMMKRIKPLENNSNPLVYRPALDPFHILSAYDYEEIAKSWLSQKNIELNESQQKILHGLCVFYATLQLRRKEIPQSDWCMFRLRDAIDTLCHPSHPTYDFVLSCHWDEKTIKEITRELVDPRPS